ncbi:gap junction beta-2 protein-like [Narcine bancroftii]|uniref:gap junction beta-2 protein-like n=1 Tax=Narcine bancroftii TaxID=1343680 RepID=UPI003831A2CB
MDLDMEMILTFLSGTQPPVSSLVRNSLASLFAFRLFTIIVTAETVWRNDLQDLFCNSTHTGCRHQCYNNFSTLSPFTLFTLQTIFITTLLFIVKFLQRQAWGRIANGIFNMFSRILIEGFFLLLWHLIHPGLLRQSAFKCNTYPCEETVICNMRGNREKNIFSVIMYLCSFACIVICANEIVFSI